MKFVRTDTLLLRATGAGAVLWSAVLGVLWCLSLDTSPATSSLALLATFVAMAGSAALPGRAARAMQRVLILTGALSAPAIELAEADTRTPGPDNRRRMLLGVILAVTACGAASTALVFLSGPVAGWLWRQFSWSPLEWDLVKLAIMCAGMVPICAGMCLVFLAGPMLRGGGDCHASSLQDAIICPAAALLALALAWKFGANMQGLAVAIGAAMLGLAVLAAAGPKPAPLAARQAAIIDVGPRRGGKAGIVGLVAGLVLAMLVQDSLLEQWLCICQPARLTIHAGTLLAVFAFLDGAEGRSPLNDQSAVGACIALAGGVLMQCSLLLAGGTMPSWGAVPCAVLAGGLQVPMAALVAGVLVRQRRHYCAAGGRGRGYLGLAACGAAVGAAAFIAYSELPRGYLLLGVLGAGVLTGLVLKSLRLSNSPVRIIRWAACGSLMLLGVTAIFVPSARWALHGEARCAAAVQYWTSPALDELQTRLMKAHRGQWWVAARQNAGGARPGELPNVVRVTGVDQAFLPPSDPAELFDGLLLAPAAADSYTAWRHYNNVALGRCVSRLHAGGLMIVRTQCRAGGFGELQRAAREFAQAVGGWAVVDASDGAADVLLVGPSQACPALEPLVDDLGAPGKHLRVLPAGKL